MDRDTEERVLSLAKPIKKGLMHLIFSRFFLILVLLAAEVVLIVSGFLWFREKLPEIMYLQTAFSVIMIIYLFNCPMDSSAKLTWMLIISIMPLMGAAFLLFTQSNIGHRLEKRMVEKEIGSTRHALRQKDSVIHEVEHDGSGIEDLCTYLNQSGCFPLYNGSRADYFPSGEAWFEAVLRELEKAEEFIFLEFFIIEEGYMWGRILDILTRKSREGVQVRVMYDGMCEKSNLPAGYWKLLEAEGIQAKPFSEIKPVVSSHYNYRDHRKILVIDGRTAFTGGINLADEYINKVERFGHWKDAGIMIQGPAAKSFTLMFLQMWNIGAEDAEYDLWLAGDVQESDAEGYVMPYDDCPLDGEKVGETVYMDILNRATEYVHIMTPYLILDDELKGAMCYAARRGVDVRLILPGIPDKKIAFALAKTHYKELTAAGVKVYEYTPGFVHAKVFVSDDIKAVVGTINLDYRSLYHHFECAAYLYKTDCIREIEEDFQHTMAECSEVTEESMQRESLMYKVTGQIVKLISPLM